MAHLKNKSLPLAVLTALFGLVLTTLPALAEKPKEPAKRPAGKPDKAAPATADETPELRKERRAALLRLVNDHSLPAEKRIAYYEALGNSYAAKKPAEENNGKEAVAAGVALIHELLACPEGVNRQIGEAVARLTVALGQLGFLDPDAAVSCLIALLDTNEIATNPDCPACWSPYAPAEQPYFTRYVFGRDYRIAAADALGKIGSADALATLDKVLLRDAYPGVNRSEEILLQRMNFGVRKAAADAEGAIGSEASLPTLAIAAEADPNPEVRDAAKAALAEIRKSPKEQSLKPPKKKVK